MRIRLVVDKTGPRWDGQDWPPCGGEIDVPDDEAVALIEHRIAVPVADGDSRAVADADTADVETRAAPDDGAGPDDGGFLPAAPKPIVNSPKAAWVDHAVSLGFDRDEAAGMSKADLIAAVKP